MNVHSVNINTQKQPVFGHNNPWADSPYKRGEQVLIAGTTALGVLGSMAVLAKLKGASIKPNKLFGSIKNYWKYTEFDDKPIIAIGAGSCLGGLVGGCIVDRDKENRKAKLREALLQMFNISIPILFVEALAGLGAKTGKKYFEKGVKETYRTKLPKAVGGVIGLFAGVFSANIIANKINEKIFHRGKGRPVQASDFSAHLDDMCFTARQISTSKITDYIQKLVPIALMIAGNEVGNTSAANVDS